MKKLKPIQTMKKDKELIELLLDWVENWKERVKTCREGGVSLGGLGIPRFSGFSGLCDTLTTMHYFTVITTREQSRILIIIRDAYGVSCQAYVQPRVYWWKEGRKSPRIRFLRKILKDVQ